MDLAKIRQTFVEYYQTLGYQLLPRAPMIDPSIPMSFVMSAGLVQVENSLAKSINQRGNKYVLVQKCFRHFDLEKVGDDDTHLSLFEMPGAFVFGPDGKSDTVQRMWDLATSVLALDKERIWCTYFNGGQIMGYDLPEDFETKNAWLNTDIRKEQLVGLGAENNYWVQGKGIKDISFSKKCGPNTELFYDRGIHKACSSDCKPGCKCGRFIEFSNSLFICSEIIMEGNKSFQYLDNPFAETVIGTERISMIWEGAASVFDTEQFKSIIGILLELSNCRYLSKDMISQCHKVIADHVRALYFLISDGAPPPGKNGRERIVKMLVRRTITRLLVLNIDISQFLDKVVVELSNTFPEIHQKDDMSVLFIGYFLAEFNRFTKTIERGRHQLEYFLEENSGHGLTDEQISCLEKSWGLPSLLTAKYLRERKEFPVKLVYTPVSTSLV